jgi:cytochrome c2
MERKITMNMHWILAAVMITVPASVVAQATAKRPHLGNKQNASADADAGNLAFEQHCSRCHSAPEGFSSRISGTIVRHMRVRASLSAQEERDLLRFFNP